MNKEIQSLRGIACILVVYFHMIGKANTDLKCVFWFVIGCSTANYFSFIRYKSKLYKFSVIR